ncbi:hypothetical protein ACWGMO_04245 [Nocardia salmonicida]
MRRRILRSILTVLTITTVVLGVPLIYTAWLWVEDITRNDLQSRLERISTEVIAQERVDGTVHDGLDVRAMSALVPEGGKLTIVYPTPDDNAARWWRPTVVVSSCSVAVRRCSRCSSVPSSTGRRTRR